MSRRDKKLDKMRANPRDWRIEDLKSVAEYYGIEFRQPGTSHVTFSAPGNYPVTVPAHKPIKPIYVEKFAEMIDNMRENGDE